MTKLVLKEKQNGFLSNHWLSGVLALSLSLSLTIQFARLINHLKEKGIISDNYTIPYRYKKLDK